MNKDIFEQILNMLREDVERKEVEQEEVTLEEYYRTTDKDTKKENVRIIVLDNGKGHIVTYMGTGEQIVIALAALIGNFADALHVPAEIVLRDLAMLLREE